MGEIRSNTKREKKGCWIRERKRWVPRYVRTGQHEKKKKRLTRKGVHEGGKIHRGEISPADPGREKEGGR